MTSAPFSRLRRFYTSAAILTLNVLLTLVAVNLVLKLVLYLHDGPAAPPPPNQADAPRDLLSRAYGDMPMAVVEGTLNETYRLMQLEAKPWVHYDESEFHGQYVNVSADGERSNGAIEVSGRAGRPWRVDVFGGSTVWGSGVPDSETIPAHLERALARRFPGPVQVRNRGHAYYFSSQELASFVTALRHGDRPDTVVFLDGLNEHLAPFESDEFAYDEPAQMARIRAMWEREGERRLLPYWIPLVEVSNRVRRQWGHSSGTPVRRPDSRPKASPEQNAHAVFSLYSFNKRAIQAVAAEFGVATHFFWQPTPFVAYDVKRHLFWPSSGYGWGRERDETVRRVYAAVAAEPNGVIDLSGLLRDYTEPAYIDKFHYAPKVNRLIAEAIADRISWPAAVGAQ